MSENPLRCGLCQVEVTGSWKDHEQSEGHQSRLPKKKDPVEIPVREVSETEKRQNRDKIAKAENLGYSSVANGRSYYRFRCECGEVSDVFAWRGCKRCPNCGKLLHTILSFKET